MRARPGGILASPKAVGAIIFVGAILLAYELGQWMLQGGIHGLALRLALLVGTGIALAVLVRWRNGILLFLGWLVVEDLVRKYMGNPMYVYFVKDALLAVVYAAYFVGVARGRERVFRPGFWVPLVALFFLALGQSFNPRSTSVMYGVLGMKIDFYYIPLIFLAFSFLRNREDLDRFLAFSFLLAILVAGVGIIQGLGWRNFLNPATLAPQFRSLAGLWRWAPGMQGPVSAPPSVFVSVGRYANYLALMFTLALGGLAYQIFRRRPAKLTYLAVGVLATAIFLSGSKGTLVYGVLTLAGVGLGLLWGARRQPWASARLGKIMRRSAVALAAGLLMFVAFYPNLAGRWWTYYYEMLWPDSSSSVLEARTGSYPLDEFEKVLEYSGWAWGYGTGTASLGVQYVTGLLNAAPPPASPVENGFGDMIVEWGVLGPILWVMMSVGVVVTAWKVTKRLAATPYYPLGIAITWFAFWVLLPFTWGGVTVYQNYVVNAYLWMLIGVLWRLPDLALQPERSVYAAPAAAPLLGEPVGAGLAR